MINLRWAGQIVWHECRKWQIRTEFWSENLNEETTWSTYALMAWSVDHGNNKPAMKITGHKSLILNWPNVVSSCGFLWLCVELWVSQEHIISNATVKYSAVFGHSGYRNLDIDWSWKNHDFGKEGSASVCGRNRGKIYLFVYGSVHIYHIFYFVFGFVPAP